MPRFTRPSGIVLDVPPDVALEAAAPPALPPGFVALADAARRSAAPGMPGFRPPGPAPADTLVEALRGQELVLLDDVVLGPAPAPPEQTVQRRSRGAAPDPARIEVPLAKGDAAIILLERDGVFSWSFSQPNAAAAPARRSGGAAGPSHAVFEIGGAPELGPAPARRGPISDAIGDFVLGRVRAIVFRFVAQVAVEAAMPFLERHVQAGLVQVAGTPGEWVARTDATEPPRGTSGRRRVLLLLHGTFSSTRGSFGALAGTPWGQEFLGEMAQAYDEIVGFDHPTLSLDPQDNARALLRALEEAWGDAGAELDAVGFSRGGLVLHALAGLIGTSGRNIAIGRACLVGVPNHGTTLAEPKNWRAFVDLYTNLAMGALQVARLFPGAVSASLVAQEAVKGLGAFVRYLVSYAVEESAVPGLSAMRPGSAFLASLARSGPGIPPEAAFAVVSEFEPTRLGDGEVAGLPGRLLATLADGLADELLGNASDLVVNTASMRSLPRGDEAFPNLLDLGVTSQVYHTIYFDRPEVVRALQTWLTEDQVAATAAPARRSAGLATAAALPEPAERRSARIVTIGAEEPLHRLLPRLAPPAGGAEAAAQAPDFVVIRRLHHGAVLNYAFRPAELAAMLGRFSIQEALRLSEEDQSPSVVAGSGGPPLARREAAAPARARHVVTENGMPAEVIFTEPEDIAQAAGETWRATVGRLPGLNPPMIGPLDWGRPAGALGNSLGGSGSFGSFDPFPDPGPAAPAAPDRPEPDVGSSEGDLPFDNAGMRFNLRELRRGERPEGTEHYLDEGRFSPARLDERFGAGTDDAVASSGSGRRGALDENADHAAGISTDEPGSGIVEQLPGTLGWREDRSGLLEADGTSAPDEVAEADTVACEFLAELPAQIPVGEPSSLVVTVSREVVEALQGQAAARGQSAAVRPGAVLIVQAWARKNLRLAGQRRAELKVPPPGKPARAYFDVVPTAPGPAEVMVTIRQESVPLAELDLTVEAAAQPAEEAAQATARAAAATLASLPKYPPNQLRIVASENAGELRFTYELSLPGRVFDLFESDPIEGTQESYVAGIYRDIERRYARSEEEVDEFKERLKALGGQLFDQLFPPPLRKLLWTHRDGIDAIQVISTEPFVPWELVFLKDPEEPGLPDDGKFLAELGLTRWIHHNWHPSAVRIRKDRRRYVIPDYPNAKDRLVHAEQERKWLEAKLGATPVEPLPVDVKALLKQRGAFDLLHFACHGTATSNNIANAALELRQKSIDATDVEQLARLRHEDGSRPMVVLNACQSARAGFQLTGVGGFAQAFVKAGAGVFVGTLWSVIDEPALVFVQELYTALREDVPLGEAAKRARAASATREPSSWLAYAVYGDPNALITWD